MCVPPGKLGSPTCSLAETWSRCPFQISRWSGRCHVWVLVEEAIQHTSTWSSTRISMYARILPETIKMFDCSVFEFPIWAWFIQGFEFIFWKLFMGVFEFRKRFCKIFVRGSNFLKRHGLSFVDVPAGGNFCKQAVFVFCCDVPAEGKFCKNKTNMFLIFWKASQEWKTTYLLGFEPHEYARTLSFEKSYPTH